MLGCDWYFDYVVLTIDFKTIHIDCVNQYYHFKSVNQLNTKKKRDHLCFGYCKKVNIQTKIFTFDHVNWRSIAYIAHSCQFCGLWCSKPNAKQNIWFILRASRVYLRMCWMFVLFKQTLRAAATPISFIGPRKRNISCLFPEHKAKTTFKLVTLFAKN